MNSQYLMKTVCTWQSCNLKAHSTCPNVNFLDTGSRAPVGNPWKRTFVYNILFKHEKKNLISKVISTLCLSLIHSQEVCCVPDDRISARTQCNSCSDKGEHCKLRVHLWYCAFTSWHSPVLFGLNAGAVNTVLNDWGCVCVCVCVEPDTAQEWQDTVSCKDMRQIVKDWRKVDKNCETEVCVCVCVCVRHRPGLWRQPDTAQEW